LKLWREEVKSPFLNVSQYSMDDPPSMETVIDTLNTPFYSLNNRLNSPEYINIIKPYINNYKINSLFESPDKTHFLCDTNVKNKLILPLLQFFKNIDRYTHEKEFASNKNIIQLQHTIINSLENKIGLLQSERDKKIRALKCIKREVSK